MSSLLSRFKEVYETGSGFKVLWDKVDNKGNLTVGIGDKEGNEKFWLNVVERNGEIQWF